jgi:hypothetical protein
VNESDRYYELNLTAEPRRLTVVRRIVAAHLRHWNLAELVDLTVLGITELLANVHRHVGADAACLLRLACSGGMLRCEVHDGSTTLPELLHPGDDEISGRGLALVAAFCKEWGTEAEENGKVVWFALQAVPTFPADPLTAPPVPLTVDEPPVRPLRQPQPLRYSAAGASAGVSGGAVTTLLSRS